MELLELSDNYGSLWITFVEFPIYVRLIHSWWWLYIIHKEDKKSLNNGLTFGYGNSIMN